MSQGKKHKIINKKIKIRKYVCTLTTGKMFIDYFLTNKFLKIIEQRCTINVYSKKYELGPT